MIRLTWLQFQLQAAVAVLALAVVTIAVALTGPQLVHIYDTDVAPCLAQAQGNANSCGSTVASFIHSDSLLQTALSDILLAAPAARDLLGGAADRP